MSDNTNTDIIETVENAEETAVSTSPYAEIKEAYENGQDLTDEQMDTIADVAIETLRSILACFDEKNCVIEEYEGDEGELILNVCEGDLAILIGHHGRVLESVQSLVNSIVGIKLGFHFPLAVDIESYKARRREKVINIGLTQAEKAKNTGRVIKLKPMSAYERRLIHISLQADPEVQTYSEGQEPHRYVVVKSLV